ncbi:cytochrome b5 [Aulographum hederae CBS 113979]|uniref:Cytochrome b5 n=1 Tax=Aulographum hederae CBS 113979 TaxID=1176131 RepID=A0A6G1GZP9_9PEZI|nr:cytochrome b5 [Aulographum hederae CBS 113979]
MAGVEGGTSVGARKRYRNFPGRGGEVTPVPTAGKAETRDDLTLPESRQVVPEDVFTTTTANTNANDEGYGTGDSSDEGDGDTQEEGQESSSRSRRKSRKRRLDDSGGGLSVLDIVRMVVGAALLSCLCSFFVTGEGFWWGYRPWFANVKMVKAWFKGPLHLTPGELSLYNGTTPDLPILLALNGSIYDVSASPHTYGPGGSYHFFAGRDAARAFVTGCFEEDLTADLRGVEEMFVPVEDPEYDAEMGVTGAEVKNRKANERRIARRKVKEALEGWHVLFRGAKAKPYFWVGHLVREEGWEEAEPRRELCEGARKQKPKRRKEKKGEQGKTPA